MRKRKSNKGALIAVIASLSTVSVVSVGFASWLITGGDTAAATGSISADTAEDKRYLIAADSFANSEHSPVAVNNNLLFDNIHFGCTNNPAPTNDYGWLNNDALTGEDLDAEMYFWVANMPTGAAVDSNAKNMIKNGSENVVKISTLDILDSSKKALYEVTYSSKRLLGALPTPELTLTSTKKTLNGLSYTLVKAEVHFTWGAYFDIGTAQEPNVVNPYYYYNRQAYTFALGTEALAVLGEIEKINNVVNDVATKTPFSTTISTGALIS